MDRLLTVKDLQDTIGCSRNMAYKLMHSRAFPSFKIGKKYYVSQEKFSKWLDRLENRMFLI